MRKSLARSWWRCLGALAAGVPLFLEGCDPTIRTTVENGIINASTSLLASFGQALVQVLGEANA